MYPLSYASGNVRDFEMALYQLSANVYYLCSTQGLVFEDKEEARPFFLYNLLNLLHHCDQLGK